MAGPIAALDDNEETGLKDKAALEDGLDAGDVGGCSQCRQERSRGRQHRLGHSGCRRQAWRSGTEWPTNYQRCRERQSGVV